jgi:O-antigen/teichoic acid export membrane protein
MAYSRYIGFERAVILLFATVACALLTMIVGIGMIHLRLPPTDGAYGKPWFSIEVMTVAGPLGILCAVIAYPVMLWGLGRANLAKSLPVVFVVSVGSMAASARVGPLGAGVSLACSTAAIAWCRWRFRDTVGAAPNTTQQPTGAPGGAGG